jgi:hypothetical protein
VSLLPPSASVALPVDGPKLHSPSAVRNTPVIVALLQEVAPAQGRALEIASGTGQHVVAMATALPAITWHPTDIVNDRLASIDAYAAEADLPNLCPAQHLDAASDDWAAEHEPYDLIYLGNLLHLIATTDARAVLAGAAAALAPQGTLVIYGPFMRAGILTSEGDRRFNTELRATNPEIGYKDDAWVAEVLDALGLRHRTVRDMPANNISLVAQRHPQ